MASGDIYTIDLNKGNVIRINVDSIILSACLFYYNTYDKSRWAIVRILNSSGGWITEIDRGRISKYSEIFKIIYPKIKINAGEKIYAYNDYNYVNAYHRITLMEL